MSPCRAALWGGIFPAGSAAFAIPTGKAGIRDQSGRVRHSLVLLGTTPILRGLMGLGLGRAGSGAAGRAETRREKGIPAAVGRGGEGQGFRVTPEGGRSSQDGLSGMGIPAGAKTGSTRAGRIHLSLLNPLLNHVLVREWGGRGSINVNKPFFNGPNNTGNSLLGYRPFFNHSLETVVPKLSPLLPCPLSPLPWETNLFTA